MPREYSFANNMESYRSSIDEQLKSYSRELIQETNQNYDAHAALAVEAYCSLLSRGGKRIRGALVINAYEMCGGEDSDMILQAACAVEMLHAYILAVDDIQDRSDKRRGGPTAHRILEQDSVSERWRGDHAHTGISLALNGALIGCHYAQNILGSLNAPDDTKIRVLKAMNSTMITTAHGQTGDIINEVNGEVTEDDIDAVIERKTAHYTILNPLQIGMILAGCTDEELEIVKDYALEVGTAFQLADDSLTYTVTKLDKDPSIDIRDGKITHFILYARAHASRVDVNFLNRCLGKRELSQVYFERCVDIVRSSGAVDAVMMHAKKAVDVALSETESFPNNWRQTNVDFLRGLAKYVIQRSN